jgi:nucleotide-binding universal stress UspA family protein
MADISTTERGRVVVGVDGSPNSVAALHHAADTAARLGAELEIVLAVQAQADDATVADEARRLDELIRWEFTDGIGAPTRCEVVRCDSSVALLRASVGALILVLGAREHSEAGNLIGGSTVSRCACNARCAVEICANQHASAAA